MSHDATNWAIKQRGLKPAAKIVLWHLCDRYHPDNGCFPSLDTLAEDCEMSRRSVQDQIAILEAAGLVEVEKMPRQNGQLPRNSYRFPFQKSLGQNLPEAKSALGKITSPPLANSRESLGQNLPPNSVRGTSNRTSKSRASIQGEFDTFWKACPRKVGKGKARTAYAKARKAVDSETILEGMRRHARTVAGSDPQFIPHPTSWLNAERWSDEDRPAAPHSQQSDERRNRWQKIARTA